MAPLSPAGKPVVTPAGADSPVVAPARGHVASTVARDLSASRLGVRELRHPNRVMMHHTRSGTLSVMTAHAVRARPASPTASLFGAVMALVALTVGFATLGVYLGRDSGGAAWFVAWLLSLGCLIGLNVATRRGQSGLALGLLLAFGALTGWSVATTINYYAETDPLALRQLSLRPH